MLLNDESLWLTWFWLYVLLVAFSFKDVHQSLQVRRITHNLVSQLWESTLLVQTLSDSLHDGITSRLLSLQWLVSSDVFLGRAQLFLVLCWSSAIWNLIRRNNRQASTFLGSLMGDTLLTLFLPIGHYILIFSNYLFLRWLSIWFFIGKHWWAFRLILRGISINYFLTFK